MKKEKTTITREKFKAYQKVQNSGRTNMMALQNVMDIAYELSKTELTADDCIYIMKNYKTLEEEYNV